MTIVLANRPPQADSVDKLVQSLTFSIKLSDSSYHYGAFDKGAGNTLTLEQGRSLANGSATLIICYKDDTCAYNNIEIPEGLSFHLEISAPKAGLGLKNPAWVVPWSEVKNSLEQVGTWGKEISITNPPAEGNPLHAFYVRVGLDLGIKVEKDTLRYNSIVWRFVTESNHGEFRIHKMRDEDAKDNDMFYVDLSQLNQEQPGFEGLTVYLHGEVYDRLMDNTQDVVSCMVYSQLAYYVVYSVIEACAAEEAGTVPELALSILRNLYDSPKLTPAAARELLDEFKTSPQEIHSKIQRRAKMLESSLKLYASLGEEDSE